MKSIRNKLLLLFLLCSGAAWGGNGYSHEFCVSAGYNYCRLSYFDAGLRYYHWRNDGQTALAFAGAAIGCEFSLKKPEQIFIPYVGWQGHGFGLAYGIRAEYATNRENSSFGITPEIGLSLIEILRITGGYRFVLDRHDPLEIRGFRFSVIAALPLSFLKKEE